MHCFLPLATQDIIYNSNYNKLIHITSPAFVIPQHLFRTKYNSQIFEHFFCVTGHSPALQSRFSDGVLPVLDLSVTRYGLISVGLRQMGPEKAMDTYHEDAFFNGVSHNELRYYNWPILTNPVHTVNGLIFTSQTPPTIHL